MFGYVRARTDTLSPEARSGYEAVYCGLCHTLQREYGMAARLFLNYDFAFLAMLLSPAGSGVEECRRCPLHPIKGRPICGGGQWLSAAAGESVILAWWKLRDTITDGGLPARVGARISSAFLSSAHRKAGDRYPDFDARTWEQLARLRELEEGNCPSIDRTADCFAQLLKAAAPTSGVPELDRPREELLYHLGRWIYLIDAVDDLPEDRRTGAYNPVSLRFPDWSGEDRKTLRQTMDHSLALMGAAFELLPPNPWKDVLENIIYSGLPSVEELVFAGKWREYQTKHGRKDG